MRTEAKVKLAGDLSVITRHCHCCNSNEVMNLLDDEGSPQYYCEICFGNNCACAGNKVTTVEK